MFAAGYRTCKTGNPHNALRRNTLECITVQYWYIAMMRCYNCNSRQCSMCVATGRPGRLASLVRTQLTRTSRALLRCRSCSSSTRVRVRSPFATCSWACTPVAHQRHTKDWAPSNDAWHLSSALFWNPGKTWSLHPDSGCGAQVKAQVRGAEPWGQAPACSDAGFAVNSITTTLQQYSSVLLTHWNLPPTAS